MDHPIADSIAAFRGPVSHAFFRPGPDHRGARDDFLERFRDRRVVAEIGRFESPWEYVLGEVWDVEVSPDGSEVFVLDRQSFDVRVYDGHGTFQYALGGPGEGPGEFQIPDGVFLTSDDRLLVPDRMHRVHRYGRAENGQFRYLDRFEVPSPPRDACALSDRRFVVHAVGGASKSVLFQFDQYGALLGEFARPYRYDGFLAWSTVSRGRIACGEGGDLVFIAYWARALVEAYSLRTGALAWRSEIEGLMPTRILERPEGQGVETGVFNSERVHFLDQVSGGQDEPLIVQYTRVMRQDYIDKTGRVTTDSYLLEPGTGMGAYLGDSIPRIMHLSRGRLVTLTDDPFPRLTVYELGGDP